MGLAVRLAGSRRRGATRGLAVRLAGAGRLAGSRRRDATSGFVGGRSSAMGSGLGGPVRALSGSKVAGSLNVVGVFSSFFCDLNHFLWLLLAVSLFFFVLTQVLSEALFSFAFLCETRKWFEGKIKA